MAKAPKFEVRVYHYGLRSHEWLYIREGGAFKVGFYGPNWEWVTESEHPAAELAADRVHYLNGGRSDRPARPHECHREAMAGGNCNDFATQIAGLCNQTVTKNP